jgi:hypothetical protein
MMDFIQGEVPVIFLAFPFQFKFRSFNFLEQAGIFDIPLTFLK